MERTNKNPYSGTWVLVRLGSSAVLGRIHELNFTDAYERHVDDSERAQIREEVPVEEVLRADHVSLMPAYDFFAPIRPVPILENGRPRVDEHGRPEMGYARDPIITRIDFSINDFPVHVSPKSTMFYFISQMNKHDRETYMGFAKAADTSAEKQRLARAGLVAPNGRQAVNG